VLNLGNYAEAMIANSRLIFLTCQEVAKTLQQLDPKQDTSGS